MHPTSNVTSLFKVNAGLLCAVNVVIAFFGLILNLVVITSLLTSKLRRRLCYFMILVLSCFDLVVVLVVHPILIIEAIGWLLETKFYSIEMYYLNQLFEFSLTALLTMTIERYLALVHPYFHHRFMTKSKLIAILALLQVPFLIPYSTVGNKKARRYIKPYLLTLHVAVLLVMFILNLKLYRLVQVLRQHEVIPLGNLAESGQTDTKLKKSKLTLGKVSACLLVVVCSTVCYFPIFVFFGLDLSSEGDWDVKNRWIFHWTKTLLTMNSTLNCLIFFYKNNVLRRRGKEMMAKCFSSFKTRLRQ